MKWSDIPTNTRVKLLSDMAVRIVEHARRNQQVEGHASWLTQLTWLIKIRKEIDEARIWREGPKSGVEGRNF